MIPPWISDVVTVAPWLGALLFAGFIIWKVSPALRKLARVLDKISGVPADPTTGQKEIPGLFERMDHQDEQLAEQSVVLETIRHEVEFNNGSSVKDAIIRTENQGIEMGEKLDRHLAICPGPGQTTINVSAT